MSSLSIFRKASVILTYLSYCLQAKTKQLASLEKQFEVLKWEYEVLQVRFDRVRLERDELKERFGRAVLEVQQKASLKTALMEAKLKNMETKVLGSRELHVCQINWRRLIYEAHYFCLFSSLSYKSKII